MSDGTSHLTLEELLAEVNGNVIGDRVRAHLGDCGECRAEVRRWESVAAGVRDLADAAAVPAWQAAGGVASARGPRPPSRQVPPQPGTTMTKKPRRMAAAAVAATVLAAGAVSYGLTTGSRGDGSSGSAAAGLMSVSGCSGLAAGLGTVEQAGGAVLVLRTPGGRSVRVTISASTAVSREVPGTVRDIADSERVFVRGIYSRGLITAHSISIGVAQKLPTPFRRLRPARERPWIAFGTVKDARGGSFVMLLASGARMPVVAPDSAAVFVLSGARLSRLRAGAYVVAVGKPGRGGTLAATTVEEGASLPHDRGNGIIRLPHVGCTPSTVATAALNSAR
ncbi:MAG: hypothetical protein ACRDRJ_16360 [Streptosporangiaceae bacterium]